MSGFAEDSAALASAASAADDALQLERQALTVLRENWTGESATAAIDFLDAHCQEGEAVASALRHAADLLAALGDSADPAVGELDAGLADRMPSNFSAPVPPAAAAAPAPAMNWPTGGTSALPDIGGAIADLINQAADALNADPGAADPTAADAPADMVAEPQTAAANQDPSAESVAAEPVAAEPPPPAAETAPAPVIAPVEPGAPLVAEVSPPAPMDPDRTPCEIAADELPQVGE